MVSFNIPTENVGIETIVRFFLLLNNAVTLSLSFACLEPLFMVIGSILFVSLIFNAIVLLARIPRGKAKGLDLSDDEALEKCPSLFVLSADAFGVLAFVVLYVASTMWTAHASWWNGPPVLLLAYASIGTLVAL